MRRTRIIATLLGGVLLILGACASLATPALAPVTPALAAATPAPVAVALVPATPALASTTPVISPGQAGFLAYAIRYIVQVTPAPGQAGFLVSELQIYPDEVNPGEIVTVSVVVTNTGEQRGTYTVVLKLDGAIIETQDVTIGGGVSRKVELNVVPETCGEFKVIAHQLTAGLRVVY